MEIKSLQKPDSVFTQRSISASRNIISNWVQGQITSNGRNLLELHSKTKIRRIRLPVLKMTVYHSDPADLYVHLLIIRKYL